MLLLTFSAEFTLLFSKTGAGWGALAGALVLALPAHQHVSQTLQRLEDRSLRVIRKYRARACARVHDSRLKLDRAIVDRLARSCTDFRVSTPSSRFLVPCITNANAYYRRSFTSNRPLLGVRRSKSLRFLYRSIFFPEFSEQLGKTIANELSRGRLDRWRITRTGNADEDSAASHVAIFRTRIPSLAVGGWRTRSTLRTEPDHWVKGTGRPCQRCQSRSRYSMNEINRDRSNANYLRPRYIADWFLSRGKFISSVKQHWTEAVRANTWITRALSQNRWIFHFSRIILISEDVEA